MAATVPLNPDEYKGIQYFCLRLDNLFVKLFGVRVGVKPTMTIAVHCATPVRETGVTVRLRKRTSSVLTSATAVAQRAVR